MFRMKGAAVLAAATVLTLAGCAGGSGNGGGSGGEGESGGTLTWGVIVPATTFSAQNSNWANESPYMQAVYDSLLKAAPDGEIEPNLATEWSYNEDNTVLTLTLRDDVEFVDGEKFNADAAVQNLLRFRDGTSPNATNLRNLEDAVAVDETTVELTLTAPDPALLTYLTQNSGLMESPAAFESADVDTVPVGSGPYVLNSDETVVGNTYVFDKNEEYWNPEDQHYDKLVLNVYTDATSLLNAVQGGQVNVSNVLDNTSIPQMEGAGYTVNAQELNWAGLLLNDSEGKLTPELADVRVRQAINYAFDRPALLEALGAGYGTVTTQIFPTFSPSYDESLDSFYEYDPEKAKDLLEQAGYGDGFTLKMPSTSALPANNFTLVAQQLEDIGITVEYTDLPIQNYIQDILAQKYSAATFQLQQDPTDWQLAQFQIAANSTWNIFKVEDPKVEELVGAIQTGDEAAAAAAGKELNAYLVEQAWYAPWYRPQASFVSDANTKVTVQVGNAVPYLWNVVPA
jgi:peptide/nickel transport system substrate-binding protein